MPGIGRMHLEDANPFEPRRARLSLFFALGGQTLEEVLLVGGEFRGARLSVGGRLWARGIGANEACDIRVNLFGAFRRFRAEVGIEDHDGHSAGAAPEYRGQAVFRVDGDGRLLAESPVMRYGARAHRISADLCGVRTLRLRIQNAPGREPGSSHANWCDARVCR